MGQGGGDGKVEEGVTMFQHCTGGHEGRDRMVRAVDYLWKEAGLGRAWDLFRWVQQEGGGSMGEYSEWEEWWGHVGHVPWEGVKGLQEFCRGEHGGVGGEGPSREDRECNPRLCV